MNIAISDNIVQISNKFTKSDRLLNARQYKFVFDQAIRSSDQYFTVLARVNETGHARLGLAITKKKIRLAVGRNQVKRIVRESFRLQDDLPSVDIIVLAGKKCALADKQTLRSSLNRHWQRVNKKCAQ